MIPDDEKIRKIIRRFRAIRPPEKYCKDCPFFGKHYDPCLICRHVFKMMPHIHPSIYGKRLNRWYKLGPACPCMRYGPEYTAEKVAEFMNEL
jgi:hypothetical protein